MKECINTYQEIELSSETMFHLVLNIGLVKEGCTKTYLNIKPSLNGEYLV
jgi:hypothetical protein